MPGGSLEEWGTNPNTTAMSEVPPASPCVNICALDAYGYCVGCYRTIEEIASWGSLTAAQQRAVL
ncbi:MAG TPA: DUF1289 domain-containing protein, partial [Steroidobacteraceae bacterium]|nr:DUF1289 domain-containing protein [Steroidobacteraceae bacterium]